MRMSCTKYYFIFWLPLSFSTEKSSFTARTSFHLYISMILVKRLFFRILHWPFKFLCNLILYFLSSLDFLIIRFISFWLVIYKIPHIEFRMKIVCWQFLKRRDLLLIILSFPSLISNILIKLFICSIILWRFINKVVPLSHLSVRINQYI